MAGQEVSFGVLLVLADEAASKVDENPEAVSRAFANSITIESSLISDGAVTAGISEQTPAPGKSSADKETTDDEETKDSFLKGKEVVQTKDTEGTNYGKEPGATAASVEGSPEDSGSQY